MSTREKKKAAGIPDGVISRLPIYYRYLSELVITDQQRISSAQLGEALGITAAQIRSDFSYFGSFGQQGYGYNVEQLLDQIKGILGLDRTYHMVLIGAGNLGRAVASYGNFRNRGFDIRAIFDNNPLLEGNYLAGCIIQPISRLEPYLEENHVDIGILATPREASQEMCDRLVAGGVTGVWNFSPLRLQAPANVVVEHMHLTESLLKLSFRMKNQEMERVPAPSIT